MIANLRSNHRVAAALPGRQDLPARLTIASRTAFSQKAVTRDSVVASAFLCAYVALYLGVGFAGLAAIDWIWAYLVS